ncbi:MAG: DUF4382 domain-containing protein [Chloroflexi bacterium]|mgnify:CR=1 FL=1|jgi:plastocyanin|nr:DUF4382 domain-containing protein [Chloroflexota bacterium]MBT7080984.1 DUF4382 domain-containing protein [Chloroflexota bacterium]MBT7290533.1 DUF4382 domain-containing protein [Chloroflexota bacterium]
MKKYLLLLPLIALVLTAISCGTPDGGGETITANNFRFLISDEVNAIAEFSSLEVTISKIGVQKSGDDGGWIELEPAVTTVDLVQLQGLNATEIWSGDLDPGQYTKVFIYVDSVSGILKTGQAADVFLPSGKIQISSPFVVTEDVVILDGAPVSFVYDITVIQAGQSGKHVLQPQVGQSGATQSFFEVSEGALSIDVEGLIEAGKTASIYVSYEGDPVQGATVKVEDYELDGLTDAAGMITFVVPDDDEIKIKAKSDELEGELRIDLEREEKLKEKKKDENEDLIVTAVGNIVPGQSATILVTNDAGPVEGAYVDVNDEELANQTGADGKISFTVPADEEVEIKVFAGNSEGELELKLGEDLNLEITGDLTAGQETTLTVTFQGATVEGAIVTVNDDELEDTTDENGQVSFVVPTDADELEVKVEQGNLEGELKIKLASELTGDLIIRVQGALKPGQKTAIRVSLDGSPVQGAKVKVNDEELDDATDEQGRISFVIPDEDEIEIEAKLGDLEGSISIDLEPAGSLEFEIEIDDFEFSPATLTVSVGATVTWTNMDGVAHTVTADDQTFDSGNMSDGATFSYTFTIAGQFDYICKIHPSMQGEITVE